MMEHMRRFIYLTITITLIGFTCRAYAAELAYWQYQDEAPGTNADTLVTTPLQSAYTGTAHSIAGAPPPAHDGEVPGRVIYRDIAGTVANFNNTASLRLTPLVGSPSAGGQVAVNGSQLTNLGDFTFEIFSKIDTDLGYSSLAGVTNSTGINQVTWGLDTGSTGHLRLRIDNDGVSGGRFNNSVTTSSDEGHIADNNWHHIALVYQAAQSTVKLYVDYQLVAERSGLGALIYDGGSLYVGKFASSRGIGALFDEPRLSDTALNPDSFLRADRIKRQATQFDDHELFNNDHLPIILEAGNLAGKIIDPETGLINEVEDNRVTGKFEYKLVAPFTGWYELYVYTDRREYLHENPNTGVISLNQDRRYGWDNHYTFIRGNAEEFTLNSRNYNNSFNEPSMKIASVWLPAGKNTLVIDRWYWQGVHPITQFEIVYLPNEINDARKINAQLADTVTMRGPFLSTQDTFDLVVESGLTRDSNLQVRLYDATAIQNPEYTSPYIPLVTQGYTLEAANPGQRKVTNINLNIAIPGSYYAKLYLDNQEIAPQHSRPIVVDVIDQSPAQMAVESLPKTLIHEIDCAATPTYPDPPEIDNTTRLVETAFGTYRESNNLGFMQTRLVTTNPPPHSWFGYIIPSTLARDQKYLIEVDIPDDKPRTMSIGIYESEQFQGSDPYTLTSGIDSGNHFSLSNEMTTHSLMFWSRSNGGTQPRIVLRNAQNGRHAACSKIRLYGIDTTALPAAIDEVTADINANALPRRHFAYWYEEPDNWLRIFAGDKTTRADSLRTFERWLQMLRFIGGDTIIVTANFYGINHLYPSRNFNTNESSPYNTEDWMRMILLLAEKYGIRVIADMHPRAYELHRPEDDYNLIRTKLLVHKNNYSNYRLRGRNNPDPSANLPNNIHPGFAPMFNPVHPEVQAWYRGMITEFISRYADSPAFSGVSLRLMPWQNGSFSNFHSLDWGYGDFTASVFESDTGMGLPSTPAERHAYLTNGTMNPDGTSTRDIWMDWRADKVTSTYTSIADTIAANEGWSHVKLYITATEGNKDAVVIDPKSAGIDPIKIAQHPRIEIINMRHGHGRRGVFDPEIEDQHMRDRLLDPEILGWAAVAGRNHLSPANYLEDQGNNPSSVLPAQLGLPGGYNKTSAHINPAGIHMLERFAVALAETDAKMLGDGGNAYYYGQSVFPGESSHTPILQQFLKAFRSLPSAPFTRHPDVVDPVALWALDEEYYYLVNRERYPVDISLRFNNPPQLIDLVTGESLSAPQKYFTVAIQPYQLIAFKDLARSGIRSVETIVPQSERNYAVSLVTWLESFAQSANATSSEREILSTAAGTARQALDAGHYWRARTLVEHHSLKQIYRTNAVSPPFR